MTRFLPLFAGLALVAVLGLGLLSAEGERQSPLVAQPLPAFAAGGERGFGQEAFARGPALLHLFASWCQPCIAEAPLLARLAADGVTIRAIAVRDAPDSTRRFLERHGDPFAALGHDPEGRAMLALGATGVPETFVVDGAGIVRLHHRGALTEADLPRIRAELARWG